MAVLAPTGEETTTIYYIQDAGLPSSPAPAGDRTVLPAPNSIISCAVFVTSDGKVTLESWAVKPSAVASVRRGRVAEVSGSKRIAAYRVSFSTNDCGGGTACQPICSESDIRTLLITGDKSVKAFYQTVSQNRFSFSDVDVYDVQVDPSKTPTFSTLAAVGKKSG